MGWAQSIVTKDEHPIWDSEHISKLSQSQYVALHLGSEAAVPGLTVAALIFLFWSTVFFGWLCGVSVLEKLRPEHLKDEQHNDEKDVAEVIPRVQAAGRLASYKPEKHPVMGDTVTAFLELSAKA